jgi:hypothetical protein
MNNTSRAIGQFELGIIKKDAILTLHETELYLMLLQDLGSQGVGFHVDDDVECFDFIESVDGVCYYLAKKDIFYIKFKGYIGRHSPNHNNPMYYLISEEVLYSHIGEDMMGVYESVGDELNTADDGEYPIPHIELALEFTIESSKSWEGDWDETVTYAGVFEV